VHFRDVTADKHKPGAVVMTVLPLGRDGGGAVRQGTAQTLMLNVVEMRSGKPGRAASSPTGR
jgi:hypothetical protein